MQTYLISKESADVINAEFIVRKYWQSDECDLQTLFADNEMRMTGGN